MITSISGFADYFVSIRRRTLHYVQNVPAEYYEQAWHPGEFTIGTILRHLGAAEAMFIGVVAHGRWQYRGHDPLPNESPGALLARIGREHEAAQAQLRALPDAILSEGRTGLDGGRPIAAWRWLMAMSEHEVHHRSQLATAMTLLSLQPPQIFGLGVEDLIARATG